MMDDEDELEPTPEVILAGGPESTICDPPPREMIERRPFLGFTGGLS